LELVSNTPILPCCCCCRRASRLTQQLTVEELVLVVVGSSADTTSILEKEGSRSSLLEVQVRCIASGSSCCAKEHILNHLIQELCAWFHPSILKTHSLLEFELTKVRPVSHVRGACARRRRFISRYYIYLREGRFTVFVARSSSLMYCKRFILLCKFV